MVEKQIAESIKQGYKNILDDMKNRNITGKYYDEAEKYYTTGFWSLSRHRPMPIRSMRR
ncbi:MAG: hypothetical protein IK004_00260 [Bacteroidales bacterium]|nr:hypothetical protein [Bacteroidales bacterium]